MDRRRFLKIRGSVGIKSCLPLSCISMSSKLRFKLGYQLFSIRDHMEKDPVATLKALRDMGYEDFEHYGFDAEKGTYYGLCPDEIVSEISKLLFKCHPFFDFSTDIETSHLIETFKKTSSIQTQ